MPRMNVPCAVLVLMFGVATSGCNGRSSLTPAMGEQSAANAAGHAASGFAKHAPMQIDAAARAMDMLRPRSLSPGSIAPAPLARRTASTSWTKAAIQSGLRPQSLQGGLSWTELPGGVKRVVVSPSDGSLWALAAEGSGSDYPIVHYSAGTWSAVAGAAAQLAIAPAGDKLYALNSGGGIWIYTIASQTWSAMGGGASGITVGADNSVIVLSNGGVDGLGNYPLWQYKSGTWTSLPGAGTAVAASWDPNTYGVFGGTIAPDGFWIFNTAGALFYYSPGTGYVSAPGTVQDVVPVTGGIFSLGSSQIYFYDLAGQGWAAEPGTAASLAASNTALYAVTSSNAIWSTALTLVNAPSIAGLHVSGNEILNGSGQQVIPHGVNRSGTEYACIQGWGIFDGPSDATSVAAMAAWHINAVRVPLNEDCWLAINGVATAYSGTAYQTAISNYVTLLNSYGIIAILDLHWTAPGTTAANQQQPMADADHSPAFWTSVAGTFKNNSSVIFDLFNEPYVTTWTCWLNGGSGCGGASFTVAGMNQLIAAVRGTGATNVVMAGGLAYSNDLSQWLANEPTDPTGNLAASWHVYSFNTCSTTSCYNAYAGPLSTHVPLLAGEIGESDCAHVFIDPLMSWLDGEKSGYLGWAWNADFNCSSGPGLITDYNGTPTAYGVGLQSHLAGLAP